MKIVGIDPGVEPTFCSLDCYSGGDTVDVITFADGFSGEIQIGGRDRMQPIPAIVVNWLRHREPDLVVIEDVWVMPQQGAVSGARFVGSAMLIQGICYGLGLKLVKVRPQVWKKYFNFKKGKDESRIKALELYPALASQLARVKDHNRADALFIALWGLEDIQRPTPKLEAHHS